jgi:hypothetical protein
MKRFKSGRQPRRLLTFHEQSATFFHFAYLESVTADRRHSPHERAFFVWRKISAIAALA